MEVTTEVKLLKGKRAKPVAIDDGHKVEAKKVRAKTSTGKMKDVKVKEEKTSLVKVKVQKVKDEKSTDQKAEPRKKSIKPKREQLVTAENEIVELVTNPKLEAIEFLSDESGEDNHRSSSLLTTSIGTNKKLSTIWTQICRPTSLIQYYGHIAAQIELKQFLRNRECQPFSSFQCCLISGPSVGKTLLARLILELNDYEVVSLHPSNVDAISFQMKKSESSTANGQSSTGQAGDTENKTSALLNAIYNYSRQKRNISGRKIALLLEDIDGSSWNQSFPFQTFEKLLVLHLPKVSETIKNTKTSVTKMKVEQVEAMADAKTVSDRLKVEETKDRIKLNKNITSKLEKLNASLEKLQEFKTLFPQLPYPFTQPLLCPIICTLKDPSSRDKIKGLVSRKKVQHINLKPFEVGDLEILGHRWLQQMNLPIPSNWSNSSTSSNASSFSNSSNLSNTSSVSTNSQKEPLHKATFKVEKLEKYCRDVRKFCNDLQFDCISAAGSDAIGSNTIGLNTKVEAQHNKTSITNTIELNQMLNNKTVFQFADWLSKAQVKKQWFYGTEFVAQCMNRAHPRLLLPLIHEHYTDHYKVDNYKFNGTASVPLTPAQTRLKQRDIADWQQLVEASNSIALADIYSESCLSLQDWRFEQYAAQNALSVMQLSNVDQTQTRIRFPPTLFLISNAVKQQRSALQLLSNLDMRRITNLNARHNMVYLQMLKHWLCLQKNQQNENSDKVIDSIKPFKFSADEFVSSEYTLDLGCNNKSPEALEQWKNALKLCQI